MGNHNLTLGKAKLITVSESEPHNSKLITLHYLIALRALKVAIQFTAKPIHEVADFNSRCTSINSFIKNRANTQDFFVLSVCSFFIIQFLVKLFLYQSFFVSPRDTSAFTTLSWIGESSCFERVRSRETNVNLRVRAEEPSSAV